MRGAIHFQLPSMLVRDSTPSYLKNARRLSGNFDEAELLLRHETETQRLPLPMHIDGRDVRGLAAQSGRADELRETVRERTTAIRELRSVEERYRMVSRATNDAIWDWDFAANHVTWNVALETVHGSIIAFMPRSMAPLMAGRTNIASVALTAAMPQSSIGVTSSATKLAKPFA